MQTPTSTQNSSAHQPTLAYDPTRAGSRAHRRTIYLQVLCSFFAYFPLALLITRFTLSLFPFPAGIFLCPLLAMIPGLLLGFRYRPFILGTSLAAVTMIASFIVAGAWIISILFS